MTTSGYTRKGLGTRIGEALDEKAGRGEIEWTTETDVGRMLYVVRPGRMWAEPKPRTLRMAPAETAEWAGIYSGAGDDLTPAERIAEHTGRRELGETRGMRCSLSHVEVCDALDCPGHCEPVCDAPAVFRVTEIGEEGVWTSLQYACADHVLAVIATIGKPVTVTAV